VAQELAGIVRFVPAKSAGAITRLRRTGAKTFFLDLPTIVRSTIREYRSRNGRGAADVAPPPPPDGVWVPPPMDRYEAWLAVNRWTPGARAELSARIAAQTGALPKISVIMPVFDPPVHLLERAIRSVVEQVYGDWELCLADD